MKLLFLFVLFTGFFFCGQADAQSVFAPAGAVWHHDIEFFGKGAWKTTSVADTIVAGRACRRLTQKAYVAGYPKDGFPVYNGPDLFVYNTPDTVFFYNSLKQAFTPLYVFNVSAGDTIVLPVLPPLPGTFTGAFTDSFVRFVVDSVRVPDYNGIPLKTVFTRPALPPGSPGFSYRGPYAERIGSLATGLLPVCITCAWTASYSIQVPQALRCYNDATANISRTAGACDGGYSLSLPREDRTGDATIRVYPNPSSGSFSASFRISPFEGYTATLDDVSGRSIQRISGSGNGSALRLSFTGVAAGTYILTFRTAHGAAQRLRVAVQ